MNITYARALVDMRERRKDVFTGVVTKQADMQPGPIDKGES
jgi:hypothetical protein